MNLATLYIQAYLDNPGRGPAAFIEARHLKKGDKITMIGVRGGATNVDKIIPLFEKHAKVVKRFAPAVNANYYTAAATHMLETVILEVL